MGSISEFSKEKGDEQQKGNNSCVVFCNAEIPKYSSVMLRRGKY